MKQQNRSLPERKDIQAILASCIQMAKGEDRILYELEKKFIEESLDDDLFQTVGENFIRRVRQSTANGGNAPLTCTCLVGLECFNTDHRTKKKVISNIQESLPSLYGIKHDFLVNRVSTNFDRRQNDKYLPYDVERILFRAAWLFHKYLSDPSNVNDEVKLTYASDSSKPDKILAFWARHDMAAHDFYQLLCLLIPARARSSYTYAEINALFDKVISNNVITNIKNEIVPTEYLARVCYIAISLYDFTEPLHISRHLDRDTSLANATTQVVTSKKNIKTVPVVPKTLQPASTTFLFT